MSDFVNLPTGTVLRVKYSGAEWGYTKKRGKALFLQGPIAFVHMLSTTGRPTFDPSILVQGFVLNLIVVILIGVMLRRVVFADVPRPRQIRGVDGPDVCCSHRPG